MPVPHGGKLNAANVDKIVKHLHENPHDKRDAVEKIRQDGFRAAVRETFELDEHQKTELEQAMDGEFEDICGRATVLALQHGGKIEYRHEGHDPPNMTTSVYCRAGGDGVECGVRFEC